MARVVGMKAGIPKETPAFTVNRLCGTGVQAIVSAAQAIQTGEAERRARRRRRVDEPRPVLDAERALGRADGRDADRRPGRRRRSPTRSTSIHMGVTAENLAERDGDLAASEQDEFAVESHRRAARRARGGPLRRRRSCRSRSRSSARRSSSTSDEHIRPDARREPMGKLQARSSRPTAPSPPATRRA